MFGELSALCHIPQPFTYRTDELSRLLRISGTRLCEIIQENTDDSTTLMNNLLQKAELQKNLAAEVHQLDQGVINRKLLGRFLHKYEGLYVPREAWLVTPRSSLHCMERKDKDIDNEPPTYVCNIESTNISGQTAHSRVTESLPKQENNHDKLCGKHWTGNAMVHKGEVLHEGCESRTRTQDFCIDISYEDNMTVSNWRTSYAVFPPGFLHNAWPNAQMRGRNPLHAPEKGSNPDCVCTKSIKKRATIHISPQNATTSAIWDRKLINLPGSLEELLKIGNKKFPGFSPTKVLSTDYAEIEDTTVIRDGDHLFLLEI